MAVATDPDATPPRARPLDPRLLRAAGAARNWVILAAGLQVVSALLLVGQAFLLGHALAAVVDAATAGTPIPVDLVWRDLGWLAAVFAGRAAVAWATERFGSRAAVQTIAQLRQRLLRQLAEAGPAALDGDQATRLTVLVTRGLDALDAYLTRYLPQLLGTALVTPLLLLVVFTQDLLSGLIMAITLPMVPVFMALVGWTTQRLSARSTAQLQRLGAQLLDLIAGLPTLRALGRDRQQVSRVHDVGEAYRRATMGVLRRAFLSGLVLELFTTVSVALVAVEVGLRLVNGGLDLTTGLTVLILAPEVFNPLRMVGLHFHASADGVAAANQALDLLDRPTRSVGGVALPPGPVTQVAWQDVSLTRAGRGVVAPEHFTGAAHRGQVTALVGPNGGGKTTALDVLMGLRTDHTGTVTACFGDRRMDISALDRDAWQRRIAWVPQAPMIVPGSVAENLRIAAPAAVDGDLSAALGHVGLSEIPLHTPLGNTGVGVSAGQRQRISFARALLRVQAGADVVVLDEPTAHLDAATEALLLDLVARWRAAGLLVLVVAHRPDSVAAADRVLHVTGSQVSV